MCTDFAGRSVPPSQETLESRLLSLGSTSVEAAKLSRYLMRLYSAAEDYLGAARTLSSEARSTNNTYSGVERIWMDAKELTRYGRLFNRTFRRSALCKNIQQIRSARDDMWDSVPSGDLAALYRGLAPPLLQALCWAGCPEVIGKRYVDDVIGLVWEMEAFVSRLRDLNSTVQDPALLISHIVDRWDSMTQHLWYHLGGLEEYFPGNYNPGVLGWSLPVLWEIDSMRRKRQAMSE